MPGQIWRTPVGGIRIEFPEYGLTGYTAPLGNDSWQIYTHDDDTDPRGEFVRSVVGTQDQCALMLLSFFGLVEPR